MLAVGLTACAIAGNRASQSFSGEPGNLSGWVTVRFTPKADIPLFIRSPRERGRPSQQDVLDVFIFKHSASCGGSLHLVEHVREGRLELERFLDFFATHVGMLAVFEEAWPLVFAEKLDYGRRVGRVVRRPSLEGLKGRLNARLPEEDRGIFAVFIEIGIEDALVHHVALPLNGEDHPP